MSTSSAFYRARAVKYAVSQIGTLETRTKDNPQGNVVKYWTMTKPSWQGAYWCGAFVTASYLQVGVDIRGIFDGNPYHAGVIRRYAQRMGWWKTSAPKSGDIAIFFQDLHIEIVESGYTDVGGNTSSGTGSFNNGGGVFRRTRGKGNYIGGITGWVDSDKMVDYLISKGRVKKITSAPASAKPSLPKAKDKVVIFQQMLEVKADSDWGKSTDARAAQVRAAARGAKFDVRLVQGIIDTVVDGAWGKNSRNALRNFIIALQRLLGVRADGAWGPKTEAAYAAFRRANYMKF